MRRFLHSVLALCAAIRLAAAADELTLDDAIHQALKATAAVQNAAIESEKLAERRASLKTQLLPSARVYGLAAQPFSPFDFTISKGSLGTDSGGAPLPAADARFQNSARPIGIAAATLSEPLSQIPSIRRGVRIVDLQKQIADEQSRLERQTLVRDVRQLYYGIQSLGSALRAAEEGVRLSQEVVRVTSEYAAKRQVLDVDYLEAQVHLARFNENVLDIESQRDTLESKLNHKMGRDILTEFTVPEIPESSETQPALDPDLATARQRALAERPEVRQAHLKLEQARLELSNAAATFNPTIAAELLGIELINVTPLLPNHIGAAGVSLTWEPFTWGRRKHDLAARRDDIQEAMNLEKEASSEVQVDVAEQFRRLELAAAKLRVASLSRQMAAESLRIAQKQYAVEYSLLKTVLEAQTNLENADANYQRIVSDLWAARAEYDRALGQDQ
jgi:outer membrane protein TolC